MKKDNSNKIIWTRVAQVAAVFAFIISMLLIVNYAQYKNIDPIETEIINTLIDRLNQNPDDQQLREQVRTLDLLSRKAYFTNQWQVRTGGYLLLICVGILVIAMQAIASISGKYVEIPDQKSSFIEQKNARKWISIFGGILVATALIFAYFTHSELTSFPEIDNTIVESEISTANESNIANNIVPDIPTDQVITSESKIVEPIKIEQEIKKNEPKKEVIKQVSQKKNNKNSDANQVNTKNQKQEIKSTSLEKKTKENKKTLAFPSEKEINNNHPSFRGPGGNGISYNSNIPNIWNASTGENILWKLKIPIHGFNSPIIWDDKIFLSGATADKREIYCIDRNKGNILWTVDVSGIEGSPTKSPETTDDTGLAAPSLTTDGQRVYAIFGNGDLIAVDMSGKKVWARNLGNTDNHYGHSSSLYLYQDILILQYDTKTSPKLMGVSAKTGENIWSTERKVRISWASPIVVNTGNKTEIILVADPIVASYDPKTGKENWQIDCIFGEVGPSAAYADGIVFAVNEYAILVAIKVGENPEIIWESDEYLSDVPSPVATNELLFMATSYGAIICYDAKTGQIYWEQEYDNGFYSSPMLADGKIYLMDMQGIMHIFKAEKEFELISNSPIGEKCMTTPAFTDNRIYIRGNDHLFCIGK